MKKQENCLLEEEKVHTISHSKNSKNDPFPFSKGLLLNTEIFS